MNRQWILLGVGLAALVVFLMPASAAQPPVNQDVTVTNDAAHPVPTAAQGTTNVAGNVDVSGTVSVGNLPASQTVNGTVNVANLPAVQNVAGTVNVGNLPATQTVQGSVSVGAPSSPVTLRVDPGLNGQPVSGDYTFFSAGLGNGHLNGQLAIGSITATAIGSSVGAASILIFADNCNGNGYGVVTNIVVPLNTTQHLDYPVPNVVPSIGAKSPFCLHADLSGTPPQQASITIVGFQP